MIGYLNSIRRVGALALAVVITLTCVPLFGPDFAYALDDEYEEREVTVQTLSKEEQKAEKEKAEAAALAAEGVTEPEGDTVDEELAEGFDQNLQPPLSDVDGRFVMTDPDKAPELKGNGDGCGGIAPVYSEAKKDAPSLKLQEDINPEDYGINVNVDENGIATVAAYIVGDGLTFESVHIDAEEVRGSDAIRGDTVVTGKIDMKAYGIGYHYLEILILHNDVPTGNCLAFDKVATGIYEKPTTFKTENFTTKRTSIKYYNAGNSYSYDSDCEVYVDFKKKGGKWSTKKIHAAQYYEKSKGGFKAGATYSARGYYLKSVEYWKDHVTYDFKGPSKTVKTLKTGYKKPKVSKISISKVKQKVHKYRYWTGKIRQRWLVNARTGQRIRLIKQWKVYRTVRSYTTRYKVTVKFKKKQGVCGIQLHTSHGYTVWLGGDKKKYSKTFTVSGKKKGKKVKISVKSRRSKKYDGWSGTYKKRLRVR